MAVLMTISRKMKKGDGLVDKILFYIYHVEVILPFLGKSDNKAY
jgi:hypothetical protein